MLSHLIEKYGKEKINTLTKYPSILTLHEIGNKGKLSDTLTTDIKNETMYPSEKIDGTNVRIICLGNKYLIGSRKEILYYSEDLYWNEALDIVNQIKKLKVEIPDSFESLTIVYGELYGGKVTSASKNYGKDRYGFRVFDIAEIKDLSILDKSVEEISSWRESAINSTDSKQLRYGQSFYDIPRLLNLEKVFDIVPYFQNLVFEKDDHATIFEYLKTSLPKSKCILSESGLGKSEGMVLRNYNRSKIVKIRFQDYERTLRANN